MTAPSEYGELVRRLRELHVPPDSARPFFVFPSTDLYGEAADAIEALQKRVGELSQTWANFQSQNSHLHEREGKLRAERDALARLLREAHSYITKDDGELRVEWFRAYDAAMQGEKGS